MGIWASRSVAGWPRALKDGGCGAGAVSLPPALEGAALRELGRRGGVSNLAGVGGGEEYVMKVLMPGKFGSCLLLPRVLDLL